MADQARKSDLVDVECQVKRESDKAFLIHDGRREAWLPKSQVEIEYRVGHLTIVTMPEWLALEKGLI